MSNTTKISASALGTAAGIVIAWLVQSLGTIDVPAEVGAAIGALSTGIISLMIPDDREA